MNIAAEVNSVETAGAMFRLMGGDKVRVWYPDEDSRHELASRVAILRNRREDVAAFLRFRNSIPALLPELHLVKWELAEPPIAIETCAVVTDPALFARTTLRQLQTALANPKRWVGWSVPQLIDRLAQVGVLVTQAPDRAIHL